MTCSLDTELGALCVVIPKLREGIDVLVVLIDLTKCQVHVVNRLIERFLSVSKMSMRNSTH